MEPGIGECLREAREARGLELAEVEERTKIRRRYLVALEEERWEVLPGAAYVRGFLRTYAAFVGLDGKALVERYRAQQPAEDEPEPVDQLTDEQLRPGVGQRVRAAAGGLRPAHRNRDRSPRSPPARPGTPIAAIVVAIVALVVLAGAIVAALDGGEEAGVPAAPAESVAEEPTTTTPTPEEQAPSRVEVELEASGEVWVCMVDQKGRPVVDGETLLPGDTRGPFRAREFEVTFGNGEVRMTANGDRVEVPLVAEPIGFGLTPDRVRELDSGAQPTCA